MSVEKQLVGWREWFALPDLGIPLIKAKIDTGAATSSLHAEDLEIVRKGHHRVVRFTIHPMQRSDRSAVRAEAYLVEERKVRSSNGQQEIRPVIRTTIEIRDRQFEIELTLTRRDVMGFRMLLGREAMRGRLIVDPQRSFVTRKVKRVKKPKPA